MSESRISKTKPSARIVVECPFPDVALPLLWNWIEAARNQVADDFGPRTSAEFIEQERARVGQVATFAIYRDHELGGYCRVVPTSEITCDVHCIFSKSFYGYQTTLPALNELARQLFEAGIERITMSTFAHNAAIRALLKRGGAIEEGRLREGTRQDGRPVDVLIFGLLKREWEAKQNHPAPELDE
jgi:RimJ/RimL family protein N-acetyltransferase